ncbi:hypothetical protein PSA7680_01012 [Pseudoruegeria aquimaris]|uniref:Capsule polysaccharide biosynthesis protein n=1 Tax=Pseudoruegeria aquimaris TaxID=393663 RepID=A0A1Y5RSE0_9RHOB|nr:hypothetical protein [Pseudoruegeria aquimaris]SLN24361.1 hypothetical protein PSA7680_01012 [Pseudoruegeria aquimaris]
MAVAKRLRVYLEPGMRAAAKAGTHNFLRLVQEAVEDRGFQVEFRPATERERLKSAARKGYALFHMEPPFHGRALTFRRVYHYPFWQIERSEKRWEWTVAQTPFNPAEIDPVQAKSFADRWRKTLFATQAAPLSGGFVYVPLQGRLLDHRSFQSFRPIDMIEMVLQQDPARPVVAALHPREIYTSEEIAALERLAAAHPRLTITTGEMDRLLPACDYIVTENSSVAFLGYYLHKPAILCARIDFHHIALDAARDPRGAFARVLSHSPDYDRYLFWFLQDMSINAGRPEAREKILATLRARGWDI